MERTLCFWNRQFRTPTSCIAQFFSRRRPLAPPIKNIRGVFPYGTRVYGRPFFSLFSRNPPFPLLVGYSSPQAELAPSVSGETSCPRRQGASFSPFGVEPRQSGIPPRAFQPGPLSVPPLPELAFFVVVFVRIAEWVVPPPDLVRLTVHKEF